jgi:hypothetical protein
MYIRCINGEKCLNKKECLRFDTKEDKNGKSYGHFFNNKEECQNKLLEKGE